MFRVTKDINYNVWFLHKKFLFWWVKYSSGRTNMSTSLTDVKLNMINGHFEFNTGEYGDFWYIKDHGYFTEEFFKNTNEFISMHAEDLI